MLMINRRAQQKPLGVGGYSLMDMVVVIVLMGVILGYAISRVSSFGWRLDAAAREVSQRARIARALAVMRQHAVIVTFDVGAGAVVVHEDKNDDGVRDDTERVMVHPLEKGVEFTRGLAPAFETFDPSPVTFSDERVTFLRNGSASQEGAVYLSGSADEEKARVVVISRATGFTRILNYAGSGWITHEE